MLAQRSGKTSAEASRAAAQKTAKAPAEKRVSAPKMNFADAHALKVLPGKIVAAEGKIAELEHQLSDSNLYSRAPEKFARLSLELADIRAQKDADEERWLALEMEREAVEQQER
jgi:ATP-binding cassette subfamily F protein uup